MGKKIGAIVIAKNEGKKIRNCLKSISWVDEIIFVDTGSSDNTKEIAKKFTESVYTYTTGSYDKWRNFGLKKSSSEWILYVDADERVTGDLKKEVLKIIKQKGSTVAHAIPRRNIILGKEMKHGGWWPDYVIRFFKKKALKSWQGELHEQPVYNGELGYLQSPFVHIKHDNIGDMVEKTNKWSETEAKLMFKAGHPRMNITRFLTAMFREFWLRVVKHRAFLDRPEGMTYAIYQVWSRFVSYAKLWEVQIKKDDKNL